MSTDLAAAITEIRDLGAIEHQEYGEEGTRHAGVLSVIPDGYRIEKTDLSTPEKDQARPDQRRGTLTADDLDSLLGLLAKHASPDVEVYANEASGSITALLDAGSPVDTTDGTVAATSWYDWRAALTLRPDADWQAWTGIDGRLLDQATFAEFLEQQAHTVVTPTYADLLEVAQSIEVHANTRFKSAARTSSGERTFIVDEEHQAKAGRTGTLKIPNEITVRLKPWVDGDRQDVRVLFRYRLNAGGLQLGVKLVNPQQVKRDAWLVVVDRLRTLVGQLPVGDTALVVNGTAPTARR